MPVGEEGGERHKDAGVVPGGRGHPGSFVLRVFKG